MPGFEYKVVPAPHKGVKARGVRGAEERFALALERVMNELGEDGWEFHRSETLPSEERKGLTQTVVEWRNVLVFRRARPALAAADPSPAEPKLLAAPRVVVQSAPDPFEALAASATPAPEDNGGEATEEVTSISSVLRARAAKKRGSGMAAE